MKTFDITPEQLKKYRKSLAGMKKIKKHLKLIESRGKESKRAINNEYKLELLNVIEGYMRAVVQNSDKRLCFKKRH